MATSTSNVPNLTMNSGAEIPQLGFGVFQIPPAKTVETTLLALQTGYRHLDTAAAYRNEAEVGQAIKASGLARDEVFVTTKCFNDRHGHNQAKEAFKESLDRLETDFIDLYLIHWPVPSQDKYLETWQAFIDLRDEGLVRSIGVSNFQQPHLERIIKETGVVPAVNQIELHPYLAQQGLRREHADRGILTEAWSPIAQGLVLDDPVLTEIAERHGKTTAQITLRWHLDIGNVVFPKSVTPERIEQNFDLFDFHLSKDEIDAIDALDRGERTGPDPDTFVRP